MICDLPTVRQHRPWLRHDALLYRLSFIKSAAICLTFKCCWEQPCCQLLVVRCQGKRYLEMPWVPMAVDRQRTPTAPRESRHVSSQCWGQFVMTSSHRRARAPGSSSAQYLENARAQGAIADGVEQHNGLLLSGKAARWQGCGRSQQGVSAIVSVEPVSSAHLGRVHPNSMERLRWSVVAVVQALARGCQPDTRLAD